MSSEWRAGSDDEGSEGAVLDAASAGPKRLSKAAQRRVDDESEYDGSGGGGGSGSKAARPRAGTPPRRNDAASDESVYERVLSFVATQESLLGSARSDSAAASTSPGCGLSPDLASQPWPIQTATLHTHQMLALNWLKSRFELGLSALLADEMGLGKTLSSLAFLAYLFELAHKQRPPPQQQHGGKLSKKGVAASSSGANDESEPRVGPFLILCPLTLVSNWVSELESFVPSLQVLEYTGSRPERESLQEDIRAHIVAQPKASRRDPHLPFHVLLTTYETAISDAAFLSRFHWRVAIVDEAHRLKNADSVLATTLASFRIGWKLLLSGTPVQNDLTEVWSLLWQLHPDLFDDKKKFVDEFAALAPANTAAAAASQASNATDAAAHSQAMERLHALLRPFMLRRLLAECALDIPPKRELILRTGLTGLQKGIYKNLLLKNYELIGGAGGGAKASNSRALVNIVQSLRKVCNHAYHFAGAEPEPFEEGPHIFTSSGKFTVLVRLLRVCKRLKRRVLLFSTSVQSLDLVQDTLTFLQYSYERLDGSVRGEERYDAIRAFQNKGGAAAGAGDEETFVFLLSTRAGGVGLNLCCADTVVFLDSDWNPQCDLQAQARAHRIGQTKPVLVVRLLVSNTLEEIILKRTQRKLAMTHSILEKGRFKGGDGDGAAADGADDTAVSRVAEDNDALGRSAHDLQNILQYGLADLFADGGQQSQEGGAANGAPSSSKAAQSEDEQELTEAEIEAILASSLEEMSLQQQSASSSTAAAAAGSKGKRAAAATVPAAFADDGVAAAAPVSRSTRPSLARVATHALPSLEAAASADGESLAASQAQGESVYMFEGTDFLAARKEKEKAAAVAAATIGLDFVEAELELGAQRGHAALAALVAKARAAGELSDPNADFAAAGGASAPGSDRKRKALTQETEEEREERLARQRELARQRADSARKRREEAEAARQEQLHAMWQSHGYVSSSVALDEELEQRYAAAASDIAVVQPAEESGASEWGAGGGEEEEEEHKDGGERKAMLHYVVGDCSCPFIFEREDGQRGTTSEAPAVAAPAEDEALNFLSSFDEAAESAALETSPEVADAHMRSESTDPSSALLLVPVDASGTWGRGGLFRALDNRSSLIGMQYELIGQMEDLHLGDVHVVEVPADQVCAPAQQSEQEQAAWKPAPLHVALCVVLKRAKGQQFGAPALQPEHLSLALRKLSSYARQQHLSVHLPRLGKDDPNIGWYGIERLLRKHVIARGVSTFVYYFARRRPQYRSPVKNQLSRTGGSFAQRAASFAQQQHGEDASSAAAAAAASDTTPMQLDTDDSADASATGAGAAATAAAASASPTAAAAAAAAGLSQPSLDHQLSDLSQFVDIFTGSVIFLHRGSEGSAHAMSDSDARLVTRFLAAYDGEVSGEVTPRVTHIVTCEPFLTPELSALKAKAAQRVRVVQLAWVEQCVLQGRLDDSLKLQVGMPN